MTAEDSRAGRIVEAVLIALLAAAAEKLVEHVAERFKRRKRAKGKTR